MSMKQKAKIAARKKLRERKELEKKLGIPESDIAYDLEAYMKNKPLIKKNRASARKLKGAFLSEDTDVFVMSPNRQTFYFPQIKNLNFGD